MAYMETRPGNRKVLQHHTPQRASRVCGRRILIRSEISGIRRLTGARIIALHLLNKDAGLQSDIEALLPILGAAPEIRRQTGRHPQRA